MRHHVWLSALLLLVVSCAQQPAPTSETPSEFNPEALSFGAAVWTYTDLVGQSKARTTFYNFAASHPINNIYLEAEYNVHNRPAQLAAFIQDAVGRKFKVELLTGHPEWALTGSQYKAVAFARKAAEFVNTYPAVKGTALHLDVEPYLLPEWSANTQGVASQYLDMLDQVKSTLGTTLPLSVDIPCWFDEIQVARNGQIRPLSEWIISAVDTTVLMDYRDTTQGIINSGYSEILFAGAVGKKVVLGVNTKNENGLSPASTTFYEEGTRKMESILTQVNTTMKTHSGYGGLAVFTYEDYSKLRK
ncbi:hypothetical protein [Deinococcus cellulosilyticus]|uniref:GH18 domain-containing protein n=1 Tax=Deinococcus cellulosilyticus (strain DSM 18568 / NBRC 106333 / KACC 11606 / 5516J-15) TaxID=1223518 RepID=A0A511MZS1_DEIC1|nr:hypothetical protein [Deinococcus cellulosilyticus]GEM46049.1 hypothetical protein DC3_16840 [Deinococcus cellulosilyticus NBRC 106333 = KACC 11606]